MTENPEGTLSLEDAADMLMEPEAATLETEDAQDEPEAVETEDELEAEGDEPESDADEAEDEPEEGQSEEDQDPLVSVKVDGKTLEIPFSEVVKGYQRNADYTRKTTQVAEERRELAREKEALTGQKAQLEEALAHFAVPVEQEPNWADLAMQLHPQEYNRQRAMWDNQQRQKMEARRLHQALQQQEHSQTLEAEKAKLLAAFPDWAEPAKFSAAATAMVDVGKDYGFSPEELGQVSDHRLFRALNDLAAFRRMKADSNAAAKKVASVKPKLPAGSRVSKAQRSEKSRREKMDRLRDTGSVEDAVNLIFNG